MDIVVKLLCNKVVSIRARLHSRAIRRAERLLHSFVRAFIFEPFPRSFKGNQRPGLKSFRIGFCSRQTARVWFQKRQYYDHFDRSQLYKAPPKTLFLVLLHQPSL